MVDVKFHEDDLKTICDAIKESNNEISESIRYLADAIKNTKEKQ